MAYSARRSMLSAHDNNVPFTNSSSNNPPMAGLKPSKGSSRPSMIPRQSFAPTRLPSNSGAENMLNAPGRSSVGPRSSMAIGIGHPILSSSSTMAEADLGGPSSLSTPHRAQMLNARKMESAGARTSVAPTPNTRRSMGGRQSLAPRPGVNLKSTVMMDPRPIREDRQLLAKMEADIQDFLSDTGFVFPPKYSGDFHMPSQVLFMTAFRHIYHQAIDLKYVFNAETKKEVEEIMTLLNDIKYPFLSDLSKTKLIAPGSIHNWPPVVGMLHWMLCLKLSLEIPTTKYHGGPLERPVGEEDEDSCHYFPYLWLCYEQFWESKDEYPEEREKLEEIFLEKSRQAREDYKLLASEEEELQAELKRLEENKSPIKIEEEEKEVLENDINKFVVYQDNVLLPRIKHHETNFGNIRKELEKLEKRMQLSERERDELQMKVDAQNVSEDDFEKMIHQREELADRLKQAMGKLQEQSSVNSSMEVTLSNKQLGVEKELEKLSDNCRSLDMFPYILSNGNQIDDFVVVAGNTNTMLTEGLDLDRGLKRKIIQKREALGAMYRDVTSKKIKDQEKLDVIMEEVDGKRGELTRLDTKHKSIKDQTEVTSNIREEEARLEAEAEASNELILAQLEQASRHAVDQAESKLESAKMQMSAVRHRDEELRKQLHKEYAAGLETILSLKSLVTEGLNSLDQATESHAI